MGVFIEGHSWMRSDSLCRGWVALDHPQPAVGLSRLYLSGKGMFWVSLVMLKISHWPCLRASWGLIMVSPCDLWSGRMSYCSPVVNPPDLGSGQTSCYSFTAPTKWSVKLWPTLLLGEVQTAWFLPPAILPLRILRLSRGKPDMILSKISLFLFIFCKS